MPSTSLHGKALAWANAQLGKGEVPPGSVIYTSRDKPNLRVVDVMPADDAERQFTVLVVEEV
jgi:hypothetical protein